MSEPKKDRQVKRYKDYFNDFFNKQNLKVKRKIIWTLELIEDIDKIPETYLKHISDTNGIYEIRVKFGTNIFRIFCFFDKGKLVILMNGFNKKTNKTPKNMIEKAMKIKEEYEKENK